MMEMKYRNRLISILPINVKGIEKLLKIMKVNKASGPDDLSAFILKELAEEIAPC